MNQSFRKWYEFNINLKIKLIILYLLLLQLIIFFYLLNTLKSTHNEDGTMLGLAKLQSDFQL